MRKSRKSSTPAPPQNPALATAGVPQSTLFRALNTYSPPPDISGDLFSSLREAVPVIDAAVYKLVRLTGGFHAVCKDDRFQPILDKLVKYVPSDSGSVSLQSFLDTFFEQLLTYGTAVAELVPDQTGAVRYLYNAPHKDYILRRSKTDFRRLEVCAANDLAGNALPGQQNMLVCTLNAKPGEIYGTPLLAGLPFVSSVLLKIYNAVGQNWERVGNVRFAVTYKPSDDTGGKTFAKERAMQIAEQWSEAMRSREARDFIAVGDVDIKTIGADNQILDSEIPVRQMLEQIVAKLSIPPYMLGLSWSTTERMASEQADMLTSELEHYRRLLTPVLESVCRTHLRAYGYTGDVEILWDDILLRDTVDDATARHLDAQTAEILQNLPQKEQL
ncbi:MAG: serine/threonine protein phosphatase [Candidatus Fimenecus sp.]